MERGRGARGRCGGRARFLGLTLFGVGLLAGCILTALGLQLSALLGISSPLLLDGDEQLATTPSSPTCVSTARQFSVLRFEDSRLNQYVVEVQDWMVRLVI